MVGLKYLINSTTAFFFFDGNNICNKKGVKEIIIGRWNKVFVKKLLAQDWFYRFKMNSKD